MTSATAEARDWPDWAGPDGNRSSNGNGVFDSEVFGLKQDWLTGLGSGYSGITVVGTTAVTGMADEESDYLVALDTESGSEKWRYRIGDVYKGHDGSDDGPLATPAIHEGKVFSMGGRGELFALDLETGKQLWKVDIHRDLEAPEPVYGFAASPVVVDGVLVVLTGAEPGRAISGFDPASGKVLWSNADGKVAYQSPLGMTIGGKSIVVATTAKALFGLDPKSGETLFSFQINEDGVEESYAHPVPIGDNAVFLNLRDAAGVFRIAANDGKYSVEEVWRNNAFINNYSIPVYWQGYLYGYSGSILKQFDSGVLAGSPLRLFRQHSEMRRCRDRRECVEITSSGDGLSDPRRRAFDDSNRCRRSGHRRSIARRLQRKSSYRGARQRLLYPPKLCRQPHLYPQPVTDREPFGHRHRGRAGADARRVGSGATR
ncbi:MAG: PQQ-binding-like beta-propeller repeat protein [Acidobacteriota bacterium]